MPIIKHVTLQKIVAHDFRYAPRILLLQAQTSQRTYECAHINDTCAVISTNDLETTQTEQGHVRLALSWDFTQSLTFYPRTSENGNISKTLNLELRAGADGQKVGMEIGSFGTVYTHFNGTEKDPRDVAGRRKDGRD